MGEQAYRQVERKALVADARNGSMCHTFQHDGPETAAGTLAAHADEEGTECRPYVQTQRTSYTITA